MVIAQALEVFSCTKAYEFGLHIHRQKSRICKGMQMLIIKFKCLEFHQHSVDLLKVNTL